MTLSNLFSILLPPKAGLSFCRAVVLLFVACNCQAIELLYWPSSNTEEIKLAEILVSEWNELHPDIYVKMQPIPATQSSEEVLLSAIVSKTTPDICSNILPAILWQKLYATDTGIFNHLLNLMGFSPVGWLTSTKVAMPSIAIMATWKNMGFYIILFLGGLLSIPGHLYEVSKIEGASRWQDFWRITLPLLRPTMLLVVVLSTFGAFSLFIEPYVMTGGGPLNKTMSVVLYMYKHAFLFQHMGYAATIGFALALVILVVVLLQKKYLGEETEY